MAYSSADGRRVFLAYRTVFTGPHAQIRKSKKVREVIEQHRGSFQTLIRDFGFDKVADIVKTLLDQRVFESELKAKIAFPELFQTSLARDVHRNESENDAARSAAEALEELTSASEHGGLGDYYKDDNIREGKLSYILYITTQRVLIIKTSITTRCKDCPVFISLLPSIQDPTSHPYNSPTPA